MPQLAVDAAPAWGWRPGPDAALERLAIAAERWTPDPALALDLGDAPRRLAAAARAGAAWLLHPCAGALSLPTGEGRAGRDLRLLGWATAGGALPGDARVTVERELEAWGRAGPHVVAAGRRSLDDLAGPVSPPDPREPRPALDVWCASVGLPLDGTWAAAPPAGETGRAELAGDVGRYLRAADVLGRALAHIGEWVSGATAVAIPLRRSGESFRSSSSVDLPGTVRLDLFAGEVSILEALVHESAHLYLFRAEAAGALVDPAHTRRYASPLRPDSRPLRGILLAFHALAHIGRLYDELHAGGAAGAAFAADRERLHADAAACLATLRRARDGLTGRGQDFLERTAAVHGDG